MKYKSSLKLQDPKFAHAHVGILSMEHCFNPWVKNSPTLGVSLAPAYLQWGKTHQNFINHES